MDNSTFSTISLSIRCNFCSKIQPHLGHESHLCKMVEDNVSTEKLKPLAKKTAKYICTYFGRAAAIEESLLPECVETSSC